MKTKVARTNHEHKRFYLRHGAPVLVWLVTLGCVIGLFYQRSQRFEIVGIAQGQVRQVATSSTGRIINIPVDLYQPVKAGQTVAIVDTILDNEQTLEVELNAELATVMAKIEQLAAQLIPTQESMQAAARNLQISRTGDLNRLATDVANYQLRVLQLQGAIAADEVTLDNLAAEQANCESLLKEDAIAPAVLDQAKAQHTSLSKKIDEDSQLLTQAKTNLTQAQDRLDQFAKEEVVEPSVDQALEVIRKEIGVQEQVMKGVLDRRKALKSREAVEIKSPIDGIIVPITARDNEALQQRAGEQVMRRIGEVVRAGDPILAVAQSVPTEIVAFVDEQQLGMLGEKTAVELVKNRTPAQIAPSSISSISPTMELMPRRLWRSPNVPQWGRPVVIAIPQGLTLVPGEVVGIRVL